MINRPAPLGTLSALGSALLFRRRPLRRLSKSPVIERRLLIYIPILMLSVFSVQLFASEVESLTDHLLMSFGISLAQTAFWLIILFAVAEPVLDLLLRSATFDEAELHWWPRWRTASRIALLTATVATFVVYVLLFALLHALPGGDIVAGPIAIIWGFVVLVVMVKDWWNNVTSQALVIAAGPAFVFFSALFVLSYPWPVSMAIAVACLGIVPLTMHDILLRRRAKKHAAKLIEDPKQDTQFWREAVELLHRAGDPELARYLLAATGSDEAKREAVPDWARVRLLAAAGQYLEAVDAGIAALDRKTNSLSLHLAMAEACLGVRDPENAAAHAEEALELAGGTASTEDGSEALLLLALACYNQWETISGLHACTRVTDCAHHKPSPLLKRIVQEAGMLARRFGTGIEEGE